ncbi:hypothetical protein E4U43_007508 [Claviceps pusilla]|uniref:Uncharacterized protein n=1 Tax=Claviceps pusilla TaxID=123648 RepID=A0A9P7NDF7_9HYPO|nr:hypothetical protein E4U43_007508 [Claviceps pusilla]
MTGSSEADPVASGVWILIGWVGIGSFTFYLCGGSHDQVPPGPPHKSTLIESSRVTATTAFYFRRPTTNP